MSIANVAPLVGAWIEIEEECKMVIRLASLLSWERGLKYKTESMIRAGKTVAPLVGAWIEITMRVKGTTKSNVAPLVGAWIEIQEL